MRQETKEVLMMGQFSNCQSDKFCEFSRVGFAGMAREGE
jgi:hypothetical protein